MVNTQSMVVVNDFIDAYYAYDYGTMFVRHVYLIQVSTYSNSIFEEV